MKDIKPFNNTKQDNGKNWLLVFLRLTFGSADLNQVNNILMFEQLQDLDLP